MIKQLLLVMTGDFSMTEYRNLVSDRTSIFNLQDKAVETPDIRQKTRAEAEDRLAILLEGEESEVTALATIIKRGPLTAQVRVVTENWRDAQQPNTAGEGGNRRRRKRRRRR